MKIHVHQTVRLLGIDAPLGRTAIGRETTAAATKWLAEAKALRIITRMDDFEKYGRLLGTIYRDDDMISLNTFLLVNNYARPYEGVGPSTLEVDGGH